MRSLPLLAALASEPALATEPAAQHSCPEVTTNFPAPISIDPETCSYLKSIGVRLHEIQTDTWRMEGVSTDLSSLPCLPLEVVTSTQPTFRFDRTKAETPFSATFFLVDPAQGDWIMRFTGEEKGAAASSKDIKVHGNTMPLPKDFPLSCNK